MNENKIRNILFNVILKAQTLIYLKTVCNVLILKYKKMKNRTILLIYSLLILIICINCSDEKSGIPAKRVILIGIDGMGIDGFQKAKTPNFDELVKRGAISLTTRAVMPTVSGPNWGSHLLGAGPEQHGITSNGWTVDNYTVEATKRDNDGYFPSIFTLIKEQLPNTKTCFYYDWDALANFYNLKTIDQVVFSKGFEQTFEKATPWIIENNPRFSFIYVGHPDEVGHEHQWGSPQYIKALEDVDNALGEFFTALKNANMFEDSHFIVVTDHGGVKHGHDGLSMAEIDIPWIISGPGIIQNKMIEQPNDVFNTASTIAYLMNLDQPYEWIGRPVLGAFEKESRYANSNINVYVPQPFSNIESGLYFESSLLSFEVVDPECVIRFTLNGSEPDANSKIFSKPIGLIESKIVKAAAFKNESRSRITTIDYRKIIKINAIKLKHQPESKYAGVGSITLINKQFGSDDFADGKWLGLKGKDLEAILSFQKYTEIKSVSIGLLNKRGSWIFLPEEIIVLASVDGNKYSEIGMVTSENIQAYLNKGRAEIKVGIKPAKTKFIKVIAKNIGACPPGHSGEGEPAWLFVDEIIVE